MTVHPWREVRQREVDQLLVEAQAGACGKQVGPRTNPHRRQQCGSHEKPDRQPVYRIGGRSPTDGRIGISVTRRLGKLEAFQPGETGWAAQTKQAEKPEKSTRPVDASESKRRRHEVTETGRTEEKAVMAVGGKSTNVAGSDEGRLASSLPTAPSRSAGGSRS